MSRENVEPAAESFRSARRALEAKNTVLISVAFDNPDGSQDCVLQGLRRAPRAKNRIASGRRGFEKSPNQIPFA
jgi:hypothetical protein